MQTCQELLGLQQLLKREKLALANLPGFLWGLGAVIVHEKDRDVHLLAAKTWV